MGGLDTTCHKSRAGWKGGRAKKGEEVPVLLLAKVALADPSLPATPDWEYVGDEQFEHFGWQVVVTDLDADGYDDLVCWNWAFDIEETQVSVFQGGPGGPEATPSTEVPAGGWPLVVGDFDGDGHGDILSGDRVYLGSSSGLQPATPRGAAPYLAVAGDFDVDGDDDLAWIEAWNSTLVRVTLGGEGGLSESPALTLELPPQPYCSPVLQPIDVHGDGDTDLVAACSNGGPVGVYESGAPLSEDFVLLDISPTIYPYPAGRGDFDGDGYEDLVMPFPGAWGQQSAQGEVYVLPGGPDGLGEEPVWYQLGTEPGGFFGNGNAAGDLDADGDDELFVGAPDISNGERNTGVLYMFPGDPAGLADTPTWTFEGVDELEKIGEVLAVGDLNGDSVDDLVVSSEYANQDGTVRVFFGEAPDPDGDGYTTDDCAPQDPAVHPGVSEIDGDGVDQDCDGLDAGRGMDGLAPGELVISEVMREPQASDPEQGQWFEVLLAGEAPVDLLGMEIEAGGLGQVQGFLVLLPGQSLVIGRSADPAVNGGAPVDLEMQEMALGEQIVLSRADGPLATLELSGLPLAPGASASLAPDASGWCPATSTYGAGDRGTPGAINDPCGDAPGPIEKPPEDEEKGCGCAHAGPPALAALLPLAALLRRRRESQRVTPLLRANRSAMLCASAHLWAANTRSVVEHRLCRLNPRFNSGTPQQPSGGHLLSSPRKR
jgi:uncharacterized protein (TIGR03382 family)